jgi:hypothetical protein
LCSPVRPEPAPSAARCWSRSASARTASLVFLPLDPEPFLRGRVERHTRGPFCPHCRATSKQPGLVPGSFLGGVSVGM